MTTQPHAIKPTEMIELALAFQQAWESNATLTITFRTDVKGRALLELTVSTAIKVEHHDEPVSFSTSGVWPNTGHSSLLGYIVWSLHNVDQQVDAYLHLLSFGAKPIELAGD